MFIVLDIYYIKLQCPFVCLSLCLYPPLSTRPSDRNQIWHTYSGRYGTHSQLKKLTHPTPGGFQKQKRLPRHVAKQTANMTLYYLMLTVVLNVSHARRSMTSQNGEDTCRFKMQLSYAITLQISRVKLGNQREGGREGRMVGGGGGGGGTPSEAG